MIRDSLLNTPIENANLTFQKTGVSSDNNGRADIGVFDNENTIQVSHVSYHSKKITKKNIGEIIWLNQKLNALPTVFLNGVTKIPFSKNKSCKY